MQATDLKTQRGPRSDLTSTLARKRESAKLRSIAQRLRRCDAPATSLPLVVRSIVSRLSVLVVLAVLRSLVACLVAWVISPETVECVVSCRVVYWSLGEGGAGACGSWLRSLVRAA